MTGTWNVFGLSTGQFETMLLVLVRVSAMLALVPIFSQTQIPQLVRFGLGLLLAFVIVRTVPAMAPLGSLGELTVAVLAQVFIGLVFGFVAFLLFTGIQFAGEIIDTHIGFAVVNIINPLTSQSVTVIGEFELALATLLYLAADAHHVLIAGIAGSFQLVPLPFAAAPELVAGDVMRFFAQSLFIVFQIAAPVAVALFLVNVMLGLMARVAPQMNVFVVGFPIQITIGLVMLIVSLPLLGAVFPGLIDTSAHQLDTVLRAMSPSNAPSPLPSPSPSTSSGQAP
ncbi:MAG: flagellar biosynthesis protein FliR [Candidatus Eremiobacteraeota bacterium]|nr:flagellar biosynthesis protein FliR [Candidatus Eremiobacteraeota bacterium]